MDLNRDGVIGGKPASSSTTLSPSNFISPFILLVDLLGKVEQTTHMDLNNDGKIGGKNNHH